MVLVRIGPEPELLNLPKLPAGPFGEEPEPWYKHRREGAPTPYAQPLGFVCGALGGVATAANLHGTAKWLLVPLLLGLPSWALDSWWRARKRREGETLLADFGGTSVGARPVHSR